MFRSKQHAYRRLEQQNQEIRNQRDTIEAVSQQARLATEEKLRFYSYISHEFNTPLSLMLTPTEDLLSRRSVPADELRSGLLLIQKNAYRLLRLIDQMLELRKTDAGWQRLQAAEQDVVAFVREIVQDFLQKAEKQKIDLHFESQLPQLPLWFDAEKLDKVIVNLLSNAFKYTPRGGYIHVQLSSQDGQACIRVADNGQGMTADEQAHAFDLFYSGNRPFSLSKGLGLALSREFIQLHQGQVQVQSAPGQGTAFSIRLPLGSTHLAPGERRPEGLPQAAVLRWPDTEPLPELPPPSPSNTTTLVVIEDHDDLRSYLSHQLGRHFEVLAAPDAETGWALVLSLIHI